MKASKFNKSQIFKSAWQMVRNFGYTLAQALKCAWANAKFLVIASERLCEFVYLKVDGTTRRAIGTLTKKYENTSGTHRPQNDAVQCYYDIDAEAWRSFRKRNLLQVIR